jgi:hypothetical protein
VPAGAFFIAPQGFFPENSMDFFINFSLKM